MARYIDVEALKNDGHPCWHDGKGNIYYEVDHAPTADVVEVVRCKDCESYNGHRYCNYHADPVMDDDFCSYGERSDT